MTPRRLFFTKGVGRHRAKVVSFEMALREAGVAQYNLVEVTSIFPPGCKIIPAEEGIKHLSPGEIVFCVMSRNSTDEQCLLMASSIGLAIPAKKDRYGYLLEHQSFDGEAEAVGEYAESLAMEMLATKLMEESDGIAETLNITQTASSEGNGLWTTTVAVAVFVPGDD